MALSYFYKFIITLLLYNNFKIIHSRENTNSSIKRRLIRFALNPRDQQELDDEWFEFPNLNLRMSI